jgi:hypothetical protein
MYSTSAQDIGVQASSVSKASTAGRSIRGSNFYRTTGTTGYRDFKGFAAFPAGGGSEVQSARVTESVCRQVVLSAREGEGRYSAFPASSTWQRGPDVRKEIFQSEHGVRFTFNHLSSEEKLLPAGKSQGGGDVRLMLSVATIHPHT